MKANRQKDQFWKDTDTWRDEPDFWRKGIMKKLPVLSSLGIVLVTGILLTMLFRYLFKYINQLKELILVHYIFNN